MLPASLNRLLDLLARLPGVGAKTAQRFALHLITDDRGLAGELARELANLEQRMRKCTRCGHLAELDDQGNAICRICKDNRRDGALLCVVGSIQDLLAIERSGAMRGRYFVLGRLLSPLDGIGPNDLPLEELTGRIEADGVREVILATPASVDGEATALLLARELGKRGLQVSRIASGIPHGGDLEYADQITIGRAIDGRRSVGQD